MTLSVAHFTETLRGLQGLMPFAKPLSESAFLLAWASFPVQAKQELTPAMLTYAAAQLLMDPAPDKERPAHLSLLRYVYRNESGHPRLDWGLKEDLQQRMANSGAFNPDPVSEFALAAAGELPAYDGPRHAPGGVLAQLQQAL
jgi:hypothetical protein